MDLIEVRLTNGETINFEVSVFDSGEYVRAGDANEDDTMRMDSIWWWPDEAKEYHGPEEGNGVPEGRHFKFTEKKKLDTKDIMTLEQARKKFKGKVSGVEKNITGKIGENGAVEEEEVF
jgi:hypothetical protein